MIPKSKTMTKKKPHLTTTAFIDSTKTALRNWPITWIVLVVGLIMTITATLYMKSSVEINAHVEFNSNCNEIKNKIINRLDDHARILLSGAALFNATETLLVMDMPNTLAGRDTPWRVPTIPSSVVRRDMPWHVPTTCLFHRPSSYSPWHFSPYYLIT